MCERGHYKPVYVIRVSNPLVPDGWHLKLINGCIARYVQAMNDQGIITVLHRCGHGQERPYVLVDCDSLALLNQHGYTFEVYDDNRVIHYIPAAGIRKIEIGYPYSLIRGHEDEYDIEDES